jgi:hypothetical protein
VIRRFFKNLDIILKFKFRYHFIGMQFLLPFNINNIANICVKHVDTQGDHELFRLN